MRSLILLAWVSLVGGCARHVAVGEAAVAPSDSAAIDTTFEAQPTVLLAVDSATEHLVVAAAGKSSGLVGGKAKASFPVGRIFATQLRQYADRIFRLEDDRPAEVLVSIANWEVHYTSKHGLVGGAALDSLDMQAVVTVTYKRDDGSSATRTYAYGSAVSRERDGDAIRIAEVPVGKSAEAAAPDSGAERRSSTAPARSKRGRNELMVAEAVGVVVRRLMHDIVDRTSADRRRAG